MTGGSGHTGAYISQTVSYTHLDVYKRQDMDNTGTLEAEKKMDLYAGKDIRMTADTHREENGQGHTTAISKSCLLYTSKHYMVSGMKKKDIHYRR